MTCKNIKLIGHCSLSLVNNLFWYLPFPNSKQAHGTRERAVPAVTEENWADMCAAITAEHSEEGAREQLAVDGKIGWQIRTLLLQREQLLLPLQLEEAGQVQNSWTIRLSGQRLGE